jgi:hypothetical protein
MSKASSIYGLLTINRHDDCDNIDSGEIIDREDIIDTKNQQFAASKQYIT